MAHIGRVLGQSLAAKDAPPHTYEKALKLLQGLHGLSIISARFVTRKHKALAGVCTSIGEMLSVARLHGILSPLVLH